MTIYAFAGPSLPQADRRLFPGIVWLPPCEAGDLLRLSPRESDRICMIDGWFDHRPAVRHKEILSVLSAGVEIFGSSSIGALRAAEMEACGMMGVGRIFAGFRSGRLTGDDEVALVHGPEEWGWRPLSIPLVDVRATICHAVRAKAVRSDEARMIIARAKSIHYVDRSWPLILDHIRIGCERLESLKIWLRREAVFQKRLDAHQCLREALRPSTHGAQLPEMIRTCFFEELVRQCPPPDRTGGQRPDR